MPRLKKATASGKTPAVHGGARITGRRKTARPFTTEKVIITLSSKRAKGAWSFKKPAHDRWIRSHSQELAKRFGVKLFSITNSGTELELLLKAKTREGFRNFLRSFSGAVVRKVTGARKGNPVGPFWDGLAKSRRA